MTQLTHFRCAREDSVVCLVERLVSLRDFRGGRDELGS